jgi:hypothetical protein
MFFSVLNGPPGARRIRKKVIVAITRSAGIVSRKILLTIKLIMLLQADKLIIVDIKNIRMPSLYRRMQKIYNI